ncbi:protein-tyrosine phosphatase-like protein [Ephemerocybe angulata]|uniref:protein-tyrosine-phosphatase n=1 Tax=Ephemerocybe angulata TaxID=980116 RepID=A0A8H6HEA1_9AGAR|nr:protein-tyrosine phosphatase-like protein [Tulosesus angulatus]
MPPKRRQPPRPQSSSAGQPSPRPTSATSATIVPGTFIYLGPFSAASSSSSRSKVPFVTTHAITHVLSIGRSPGRKLDGVVYHRLALNDSETASIAATLDAAIEIIDAALECRTRLGGGSSGSRTVLHRDGALGPSGDNANGHGDGGTGRTRILVHCSAGVSRSPTIVVGYLMKQRGMTLREALGCVLSVRPQVLPNPGFLAQLKTLEVELTGMSTVEVDELPKREVDRLAMFLGEATGS